MIPWCKFKILTRIKKLANSFDMHEKRLNQGGDNLLGFRETIEPELETEPQARREGLLKSNIQLAVDSCTAGLFKKWHEKDDILLFTSPIDMVHCMCSLLLSQLPDG